MDIWQKRPYPANPPPSLSWRAGSSTHLGNMLGSAMRGSAFVFDYVLPLVAMSAYRLIPEQRRSELFGGSSASLQAVAQLRTARGGGWQIIKNAASNHPPRPDYHREVNHGTSYLGSCGSNGRTSSFCANSDLRLD